MTYSIGEAAKIMNVTPHTLRYYDKEGLLPFIEREINVIIIILKYKKLKRLYLCRFNFLSTFRNCSAEYFFNKSKCTSISYITSI